MRGRVRTWHHLDLFYFTRWGSCARSDPSTLPLALYWAETDRREKFTAVQVHYISTYFSYFRKGLATESASMQTCWICTEMESDEILQRNSKIPIFRWKTSWNSLAGQHHLHLTETSESNNSVLLYFHNNQIEMKNMFFICQTWSWSREINSWQQKNMFCSL